MNSAHIGIGPPITERPPPAPDIRVTYPGSPLQRDKSALIKQKEIRGEIEIRLNII